MRRVPMSTTAMSLLPLLAANSVLPSAVTEIARILLKPVISPSTLSVLVSTMVTPCEALRPARHRRASHRPPQSTRIWGMTSGEVEATPPVVAEAAVGKGAVELVSGSDAG